MASTSSRLQKMILRRLRPEFLEDSFMMGPQRHMRLQILVIKLPASRTLEMAHDRLAHRWLSDFGVPSIAHAYEFDIRGNPSVKCTQPYVRIEFGRYQRSAYFFPLARGLLDSLCISVNVPWNSAVDMASTSSRLQKMILRRLRPEFLEDSFMMGPQRHMRLQLLVVKLPASRTLETAHTVLHTVGIGILRMILVHELRQFKGESSVMDTQPYV
ncbi:hypothetical protein TSPI_00668 [Trichinella spiralis]|uniref:Uncharacterized protein n=1 Tax=Trichinella spiralis TaxID=6334 RepID=A0ABR3KWG9_TRISP